MTDPTGRRAILHQFARRYSLYPLVLWTLLAGSLLAGRFIYTGGHQYRFLVWNLFLAAIPYFASIWADAESSRTPRDGRRLILPGAIWLLFLPNAPYIMTDLIHLARLRHPVPIWYDALMIFAFAWAGCLLGLVSLRIMQNRVRALTGTAASWVFALAAIGLCGPAIYMGRVLRWNSWHVLTRPAGMIKTTLTALADPLSHWPAIVASLAFTIFMLACYVTFVALQAEKQNEQEGVA